MKTMKGPAIHLRDPHGFELMLRGPAIQPDL